MTSWSTCDQLEAADIADEVVGRALKYTIGEGNGIPDNCVATVIAQHVKVQLAHLTQPGTTAADVPERTVKALEAVAKAHAVDGVRVKVTQPWHQRRKHLDSD